ncbi:MAG: hypothetical protein LUE10_02235 [Alistipes sp.]|nr:hypothetical protein [Alistipes sp.]
MVLKIWFGAVLTASIGIVACNSGDREFDARGIQANYAQVMVSFDGASVTSLRISSFYPWEVEFENPADASWLDVSATRGDGTKIIGLTGEPNPRRRRSTALVFSNEYSSCRVVVIQHAPEDYEPGTVIYAENFGTQLVEERTPVDEFTLWGGYGTGYSVSNYTATGGWIQSGIPLSDDYDNQPHEILSGGNNLQLEPGGRIDIPRLGKGTATKAILTLYAAAWDGGYLPMETGALDIEGNTSTADETFTRLPLNIDNSAGWQKIEVEFAFEPSSTNFYLRIGNNGSRTLYIDDITLESGGRGTQVIGEPTPAVMTGSATDVETESAVISGSYTVPDGVTVTSAGFEWKAQDSDEDFVEVEIAGTRPGEGYTYTLTQLTPGTTYSYRAYTVHGNDLKTLGDLYTFTTATGEE